MTERSGVASLAIGRRRAPVVVGRRALLAAPLAVVVAGMVPRGAAPWLRSDDEQPRACAGGAMLASTRLALFHG